MDTNQRQEQPKPPVILSVPPHVAEPDAVGITLEQRVADLRKEGVTLFEVASKITKEISQCCPPAKSPEMVLFGIMCTL